MRPAPTGFANYLANNRFFMLVDLFTFVTIHGETLRYSGSAVPFTLPSGLLPAESYSAAGGTFILGPRFGRTKVATKIGVQADAVQILIMAGIADLVGTLTWANAFRSGIFDGASVEVDRLICQPAAAGGIGAPVGGIVWFQGYVGDAEIGRSLITVTANSMLGLWSVQMPRRLWQHDCSHVFGDAMCQFDRTSMQVMVTAQAGSTQGQVVTGFNPSPATLYDQGTIIGLSGQNAGFKRTIGQANTGGIAFPSIPWLFPVAIGDAFEMLPGCDHNILTCQNVFNNLVHFGGQPYIPPAEFAI